MNRLLELNDAMRLEAVFTLHQINQMPFFARSRCIFSIFRIHKSLQWWWSGSGWLMLECITKALIVVKRMTCRSASKLCISLLWTHIISSKCLYYRRGWNKRVRQKRVWVSQNRSDNEHFTSISIQPSKRIKWKKNIVEKIK